MAILWTRLLYKGKSNINMRNGPPSKEHVLKYTYNISKIFNARLKGQNSNNIQVILVLQVYYFFYSSIM